MKTIFKTALPAVVALTLLGCEDLQKVTPSPNTTPTNLTTNILFVNASPDAPSLDLYVDNIMTGTSVITGQTQTSYATVPLTTNGLGNVGNINLRAKATSGSIGGVLGSSDAIYRNGNTSTNNFAAANGASYTLIAVDTINRPVPLRTLNSLNFGDVTYYAPVTSFTGKTSANADTVIQLSPDHNNSIVTYNLCKKYNNNVAPAFFVTIGTVPLGSTDVGGLRFLLITDNVIFPATSPVFPVPTSGKFAARFINASPDAGAATCKISTFTVGGAGTYVMSQASFNPNPSVGSRSATVGFSNNVTTIGTYTVTVTAGTKTVTLTGQAFADGGVYSIVLSGSAAKNTLAIALMRNK
jgi:hypothetical protein